MGCVNYLVYFSLIHLVSLNHVVSKCPKSFDCGKLGSLEFPLSSVVQPECGLLSVECNVLPYPKLYLRNNKALLQFDIRSRHTDNELFIEDTVVQYVKQNRNCDLLYNVSLPNSPSISFTFSPNITLFRCNKTNNDLMQHFKNYRSYNCIFFDIYYATNGNSDLPTIPHECSVLHLPINPQIESNSTELFDLLTAQYNLEWYVSNECNDCRKRGHRCITNSRNQFICEKGKGKMKLILVTGVLLMTVVVFSIILFTFNRRKCTLSLKGKAQNHKDIELFLKNHGNTAPKRYKYSDLKKMTNSFGDKLGEGGFASVYRGKLDGSLLVAVKILKELKGNGEEFINEVSSISRTSHVNVVTFLGFCFEGSKRALIYEFMPNGSLEKFIYSNSSSAERQLGWDKLFQIAVGIARGIEYLHQGCTTRILHFDIKPHNILLDKDFNPKISDFGLAKLCPNRSSTVSMLGARGTIGYIAPEIVCRNLGEVSHKSDVYSYGMMVLEMVGERKNVDFTVDHTSEIYFPHWIHKRLEQNAEFDLNRIVNDDDDRLRIRKMVFVGLWCIQTVPATRPSMTRVVEMLEGNAESLQIPPRPYYTSPPRSEASSSTSELALCSSEVHEP